MSRKSRYPIMLLLLILAGCGGWGNIAEAIRDDDGDGWFTNEKNQLLTLQLESGSFNLPGEYRFVVDEVRFPLDPNLNGSFSVPLANANQVLSIGIDVATRTAGTNILEAANQRLGFAVPLRIENLSTGLPIAVGSTTIGFTNRDSTFSAVVGGITLGFRVSRTFFADPNPNDAAADSDGDGITEQQESVLCQAFNGLGDPREGAKNLYLIVGHTNSNSAVLPHTKELLKSRFRFRGINLHIDDGQMNGQSGMGGFMTQNGAPVADGTNLTVGEARAIRNEHVLAARRVFAYFILLTRDQVSCGGVSAFGCGEFPSNTGGNVVVAFSKLVDWLPDIKDYQAGVMMHELGHNLGLCHPTQSTNNCPSGAIPAAERNPGASILGTPAEDPPIDVWGVPLPNPMVLVNAMSRPLDYSPTQWTNLMLGAGLGN